MRKNSLSSRKLTTTLMKILGTGVFICTILLLLTLVLPKAFGYDTYNVVSQSMEPTIPKGSLILAKYKDPDTIEEGEIIVFYSNGVPVCHRVVNNNHFEGQITTKGDANDTEDPSILSYYNVIGVVERHVEGLGRIGAYISTYSGKLFIVELLAVGVLLHLFANRISS